MESREFQCMFCGKYYLRDDYDDFLYNRSYGAKSTCANCYNHGVNSLFNDCDIQIQKIRELRELRDNNNLRKESPSSFSINSNRKRTFNDIDKVFQTSIINLHIDKVVVVNNYSFPNIEGKAKNNNIMDKGFFKNKDNDEYVVTQPNYKKFKFN